MLEKFSDDDFVFSPKNDCMMLKRFRANGLVFVWSEDDEIWIADDETYYLEVPYIAEPV